MNTQPKRTLLSFIEKKEKLDRDRKELLAKDVVQFHNHQIRDQYVRFIVRVEHMKEFGLDVDLNMELDDEDIAYLKEKYTKLLDVEYEAELERLKKEYNK